MSVKLAKNLKIHAVHRLHTWKALASVDELLMDYDGSDTTKDKIKQITITLNEKLATLKALDKSILAAIDKGNLEPKIEESEGFRARIQGTLVKLQKCENSHGKQESPQGSQGGSVPSSSSNNAKLPKLHMKGSGNPKNWQTFWLLPDNFENCVARLSSQLKHLRKDPEILEEYDSIIQDQLQSGVIEQVDCAKHPDVGRVHYLLHHGVVRWDALTTKLCVVFDVSSKSSSDNPSLNECLYSGPALTPTNFNVLLQFTEKRIALAGDIEKAFFSMWELLKKIVMSCDSSGWTV